MCQKEPSPLTTYWHLFPKNGKREPSPFPISYYFLLFIFCVIFFTLFCLVLYFSAKSFIRICFKVSSFISTNKTPFLAREILPVSSDTTIATLSDSFEIPSAALCLVPSSFAISWSLASGNIHAAAVILFALITTAPSCNGVFGTKILTNNCGDISELIITPESIISVNFTP